MKSCLHFKGCPNNPVRSPALRLPSALILLALSAALSLFRPQGAFGQSAPAISVQPTNQSAIQGSNAAFSLVASGQAPLVYRWYHDGALLVSDLTHILGADTASLQLANVVAADAGGYWSTVSNRHGMVTSAVATMTLLLPPTIVTSPTNQKVLQGSNATLAVAATGTEPLSYQWKKDGVDLAETDRITGVTTTTLSISNLQFSDTGAYLAVVSNAYGIASSAAATLKVVTTLPPLSGSIGAWGDFDNDGLVDVLLAGSIQGVAGFPDGRFTRLYHNEGAGTFLDSGVLFPQLDNAAAAWGDYNNDGDLDLLISGLADGTNGPEAVTDVYRNDGTNHFTALNAGLEPLAQGSVAWVDYDNDGRPDVFECGLATGSTNWVSRIYRNNGDGTFSLALTNLPTPPNVHGYWADYDNDGYADLLQAGSDTTYLLRNNGNGGFTNVNLSLISPHRVVSPWGDFDGNGGLEFITSSAQYPSVFFGPDYHPGIARNDGAGALSSSFDYSLDMWLFSASWGDIDNSGRACVVVSGWVPLVPGGGVWGSATKVFIYLGSYWQEVFTLGGWDNRSETWVDINGDGALDIFTTGAGLTTFWLNNCAFHRDFPQPPQDLAAAFTALDAVTLSWQSPPNTPATGRGLTYNVRVGRAPGAVDAVSPLADPASGRRLVQTYGNAGAARLFKLANLPPGTYYWSVQSVGQSYTGSPFTTEGAFTVTSSPPVLVLQPTHQTILSDSNAVFTAAAIGTKPLVFQWRKDGSPIADNGIFSGCATPTLTVANAQPDQAGAYDLVITNSYGSVTSAVAQLVVHGEPRIVTQPASLYALPTRNAAFSVSAAGVAPFAYQWYFNGAALADDAHYTGATAASLRVADLGPNDAGGYTVVITNAWGSVTSQAATLTLATFRYVNASNATPVSPYTNWATAATVIQDAINAAGTGDEIQVTNGVYSQGGLVGPYQAGNRVSLNKPLTVVSVNGPAVTTIIGYAAPLVSSSGQRCAYVAGGALLAGFTLAQGNVQISTNWYDQLGGGVWCYGVVSNCIIIGNSAGQMGGGIMYGKAVNCVIAGNHSGIYGGGAYLCDLANCTVVGNSATSLGGGAGYCQAKNTLLYSNQAPNGANAYLGTLSYSCTTPQADGAGNLTNNPAFVNYAAGNYRLQFGSPCIDAGLNAYVAGSIDCDGHPRVQGAGVDIGAYEHQPAAWIYASPTNQSAVVFSNTSLFVGALGDAPLAYRWQKDGVDLADDGRLTGSATAMLSISPVNVTDAGTYQAYLTNLLGSATSSVATLTILGPPIISAQPTNRTVPAGTNTSFTVTASGLAALSYQWRFNQDALPGKTGSSLSLTNVQSAQAGDYDVVITNIYGAITSALATLSVLPAAPLLTTQAVSRVAWVGQTVSFTVAAKGSEPMTCQWQFNGTNYPGANAFTLTLSNVNSSFNGPYRAAISNSAGFAFSTNVTLTVSPVLFWGRTNLDQGLLAYALPATATSIVAIAAGQCSTPMPSLALRSDGVLLGWGGVAVPTNAVDVVAISSLGPGPRKTDNNLALRSDGQVVSWYGSTTSSVPAAVADGHVVAVAAGGTHQLALRDDGTVVAWGSNSWGQTNVPPSATNVVAIAAGEGHSLALRADGTVVGWGRNNIGQATALSNAANVVAIAAGASQSIALLADGSAAGLVVTNRSPTAVLYGRPPPDATNLLAVSAGYVHSLGLRADRTITGWGQTNYGVLNFPAYASNVLAIAAGNVLDLALVADPFAPPIPPRIGRHPLGRAIMAGRPAVFNALAVGGLPLRFQWYRNGAPVFGQTKASLVLANVLPGDAGNYQLVAMNDFGSTTSAVAAVTVTLPQPRLKALAASAGGFRFTFPSILRVIYVTEYRNSLDADPWTELERRFGGGGLETVTDATAGGARRFYRVRALYAPSPAMSPPSWTGGAVRFSVPSVDGAVYIVQYKTNLTDSAWLELSRHTGTGAPILVSDPAPPDPSRFYRIKVE